MVEVESNPHTVSTLCIQLFIMSSFVHGPRQAHLRTKYPIIPYFNHPRSESIIATYRTRRVSIF